MNEILHLLSLLLSCVVFNFIFENYLSTNFTKKIKRNYLFYFIILTLVNTYINTFANTYLNYTFSFFYYIIISFILFEGKNIKIYALIFFTLIIVLENIVWFASEAFYSFFHLPMNGLYYFACFINSIALILFYKPIKIVLSKNKIYQDFKINLAEYIILIVSLMEVIALSVFMNQELPSYLLSILTIVCMSILILDIYIVFVLNRKYTNQQLKYELTMLEHQRELEIQYHQTQFNQYNKQLKLLHDMKNHIKMIEKLYLQGEIEKAKKYTQDVFSRTNTDSVVIGNPVLKILVTQFIEQCNDERVDFVYHVDPRLTLENFTDFEIMTIFSNLFENALEAAKQCQEYKFVKLNVFAHQGMAVIRVTNSYVVEPIEKNGRFITTKEHHLGYGLLNVEDVILRHDYLIQVSYEKKVFCVQIIIELLQELKDE